MEAKLLLAALILITLLGHAVSEDGGDARIYGGYRIDIRRVPYMASIITTTTNANGTRLGYHCGGTILRRNLILTAGHCTINKDMKRLYNPAECIVIVGTNSYPVGTRLSVRTVFAHPEYGRGVGSFYDVGLLELNGYVTLSDRVQLVNLAHRTDRPENGAHYTASGYGKNPENNGTTYLYQVRLNVISAQQCSDEAQGGTVSEVNQHFICVKTPGKSPCQGDSGGPLHDMSTNRQVGIVSHGHKDCTKYYPAAFTRVTDVLDFITSVIKQTNDEEDLESDC